MRFTDFIKDRIVVFDGAFGTMLQRRCTPGPLPEKLNLERPELIEEIHREYVLAGADVITADTFGANAAKAGELSDELIRAGVDIARKAADGRFVALDLGPTGKMLEPVGTMTFEEAYDVYARAVRAGRDADVVLVETMSDIAELRAALLAARENCDLPVIACMTFADGERTFTGCGVESFALTASPLADVVGVNCSLGPSELLPVVKKLVRMTDKPVIVQANAGLPDARLNYSVDAEEFAACAERFMDAGVRIVGGCCGTTPEYIRSIRKLADRKKPAQTGYAPYAAVCSATRAVRIDGVRVIGERINPTGKKAMKRALIENDPGYVDTQALEQTEAGADILDVNAGLPDVDEKVMLERLVKRVQRVTDLPLQIDSTDPAAVERALRAYHGKAIVNSVSGDERSLREMLPLVKKYGAAVVALTVDSHGVPATVAARLKIAARIIREADKLGIPRTDIFVDCLTLTAGAEQAQAVNTLDAIRAVKKRYGVKTVLGVSNISFGLPCRKVINTAFLSAALWAGLDLPILNPNIPENMQTIAAFNVLSGADAGCAAYSEKYAGTEMTTTVTRTDAPERNGSSDDLGYCILKGLPESRAVAVRLLDGGVSPLALISDYVIPALNEVGELYERGKLFLPRLISAADSAKLCFEEVKKRLPAGERVGRGAIVMATVRGDVHDIGKNIACTVLENYGYDVIDLGKNVDPREVVRAVKERGARLCGLSALMTTTLPAMRETVELLRRECPDCRIMVGGAVLTPEYAAEIGADRYCPDVNEDVRFAREIYGE